VAELLHAGKETVILVARETATTAKIMALILWHSVRYPNAASVVDYEAGTVRLAHGDE
jgi:hypothetical protein